MTSVARPEDDEETEQACLVFGPLENKVMDTLWRAAQPMTIRDILARLNSTRSEPLAYTTVMTVAARLASKGALNRVKQGRGYAYSTSVSNEAAMAVRDLLKNFGADAVDAFVKELSLDPGLRGQLERLLDEGPGN